MTEAEINAGISAINAAIASGELRVSYAGRSVEYRSIADLRAAKADLREELARLSSGGGRPSRIINVTVAAS